MQLTNANIRKGAKDYYEEHIDDYEEAKNEAFTNEFIDFIKSCNFPQEQINEDDIQGFLDNFSFKDEDEWISDEYESFIGDLTDQAYEAEKDRRMFDE